jgi:hypothetical protein
VLVAEGVALLMGVNQLRLFGGRQLDVTKVQAGVQEILADPIYGYGSHTVSAVSCNGGHNPDADKGDSFTCDVTIDGSAEQVRVVVEDNNGTYSIDRPR